MLSSIWVHGTVIFLTGILVGINIRGYLLQFRKDGNQVKFICCAVTLVILGALIVWVANAVLSKVIEAQVVLSGGAGEG